MQDCYDKSTIMASISICKSRINLLFMIMSDSRLYNFGKCWRKQREEFAATVAEGANI